MLRQRTLKTAIRATGVGLHSGEKVYREHTEGLVHPLQFTRNPIIDHQLSSDHFDELVRTGGIDPGGARLVADMPTFLGDYASAAVLPGAADVARDLEVTWAMHAYSSAFAIEEADFIDDHL